MKKRKIRALGLISGGLDSTIATKMLQEQGVDIIGLNFNTGFCLTDHHRKLQRKDHPKKKLRNEALRAGADLSFPIEIIDLSKNYFRDVVLKPKYGYGSGINPCIDCRLYMLKRAKGLMKKMEADFIFTGEVLGQRPMSQHRRAMDLLNIKSGLKERLLRPLSAKLFAPTLPEKMGWLNRNKLGAISGRGRKGQMEYAEQFNITDYPQPAGGCCSLPDKNFAARLKDYLTHQKRIYKKDLLLLKVGRHFRISTQVKIIIGRDEAENNFLENNGSGKWLLFPYEIPGPSALMNASAKKEELYLGARMVAGYSDHSNLDTIMMRAQKGKIIKNVSVKALRHHQMDPYRISVTTKR